MSRIRSIKPEIARSLALADVPPEARWTFGLLLCFLDDEGRAVDDPRLIKADLYPLDDVTASDVDKHLDGLAGTEALCRYEVEGRRYLHVPHFRDNPDKRVGRAAWGQRIDRPQPSWIPPCVREHSLNGQGALFDDSTMTPRSSVPKDQGPRTKDQGPSPGHDSASTQRTFDEFWSAWPGRKVKKQDARQAFIRAEGKYGAEVILEGVARLAADPNLPPQQYIPHPTTWLNGARWTDAPYGPRRDREDGGGVQTQPAYEDF